MLTQDNLKGVLRYEPETGEFSRVRAKQPQRKVGGVGLSGYLQIDVAGRIYYAHRLAFLWMVGYWPKNQIDHINGNKLDNRWVNLRDVTVRVNQENRRAAKSNNEIGLLGVSRRSVCPGNKPFVARLMAYGKLEHCSYHTTPEEAHAAYLDAKRKYHEGNTL